eukprot:TRINITY_DN6585_c0_g3_i2.p1 TRINITY_DN6585_c0_g3~~TRINITY_DN6585_c0_g3_i2.p1  ORF type:complete len:201 (+),score=39.27 TRINITY_DN6585_c0_g3_i2:2-604(+)
MITLINDALLAQGKPTVGFLNPALYYAANQSADAFNDITSGNNTCEIFDYPTKIGFGASLYWDPVTGLGSPHFQTLKRVLTNYEINVKPSQAPSVSDAGLTPLPTLTPSPLPPPTIRIISGPDTAAPVHHHQTASPTTRIIWKPGTTSPVNYQTQAPAPSASNGHSTVIIIAIVAGIAVLGFGLFIFWNRRRQANNVVRG